jgi:hypothetical protein
VFLPYAELPESASCAGELKQSSLAAGEHEGAYLPRYAPSPFGVQLVKRPDQGVSRPCRAVILSCTKTEIGRPLEELSRFTR